MKIRSNLPADSAVRRCSVTERIQEETELCLGLFHGEADRLKHLLLKILIMNTDRTGKQFITVQHKVIGSGTAVFGIGEQLVHILRLRSGKRMMRRNPAVFLFAVFKHREVSDPQEAVLTAVDQIMFMRNAHTQRTQRSSCDLRLVRNHKDDVIKEFYRDADEERKKVFDDWEDGGNGLGDGEEVLDDWEDDEEEFDDGEEVFDDWEDDEEEFDDGEEIFDYDEDEEEFERLESESEKQRQS